VRYHRRGRQYLVHADRERARLLLQPQHLAVARLEPLLAWRYEAALDLIFERAGAFGAISLVVVDGAFLVERELSPFCWPANVAEICSESTLREIESAVEPWLKSRVLARFENDELVRYLRDEPAIRAAFERARELNLCGAAPLDAMLPAIAPHVYAYRFARGRNVAVSGIEGASGAALLCGRAASVALDCGSESEDAFVRSWFSLLDLSTIDPETRYGLAITEGSEVDAEIVIRTGEFGGRVIPIAKPLPMSVMVSFDPDDSIRVGCFSVATPANARVAAVSAIPRATPLGGSAGRVTLLVRDGWRQAADADTDTILALRRRLKDEGFQTNVAEAHGALDPASVDLLHVVGVRHAEQIGHILEPIRAANVPIVCTPYLDDVKAEADWGSQITSFALMSSDDVAQLDLYLGAIATRRLVANGVPALPNGQPKANDAIRKVIDAAGAVIASCDEEASVIRDLYGYGGSLSVVGDLVESRNAADACALAGSDDYVLAHGPIDHRNGIVLLAMAAERLDLPIVIVGPVASAEAYQRLTAIAGDGTRYIPQSACSLDEIEGLYARARVYADVSWSGRGLARFARAGGYGAGLLGSINGYAKDVWEGLAAAADPASLESIAEALRTAWDAAPGRRSAIAARTALRFDQAAAARGIAQAYELAGQSVKPEYCRRPSA
jgi:hypothetical protein